MPTIIPAVDAAVKVGELDRSEDVPPRAVGGLGQAEVEHLDGAVRRDLDVGRLEVAMDDAAAVRGFERVGDLPGDRERLVQRKGSSPWLAGAPAPRGRSRPTPTRRAVDGAAHQLRERETLDQLHHDRLGGAVLHAVDRGDVRVVERGQRLRLAREPREPLAIVGDRFGEHLDRDVAIEFRIARAVHLAHAAGTERPEDFVLAEARPGRQRHVRGPRFYSGAGRDPGRP